MLTRDLLKKGQKIEARESPQSELKGNRDENSDRRCERCDWPAAGPLPESEPA
jgi:hypothetical protein